MKNRSKIERGFCCWAERRTPKVGSMVSVEGETMEDFPEFMKRSANNIATSSQATPGVEGYVFDGADGSQMAFWTCHETAASAPHKHEYDEYMVVVQGCYTLIVDGRRIPIKAGEEYFIPKGLSHGGEVVGGTRTIHAFGGYRAERAHPQTEERSSLSGSGRWEAAETGTSFPLDGN